MTAAERSRWLGNTSHVVKRAGEKHQRSNKPIPAVPAPPDLRLHLFKLVHGFINSTGSLNTVVLRTGCGLFMKDLWW